MVALEAALRMEERLGGVLALSTWFSHKPRQAQLATKTSMPVLVCHGGADMFVPVKLGREASEALKRLGLPTLLKTYDVMGHAFCTQVRLDRHCIHKCGRSGDWHLEG